MSVRTEVSLTKSRPVKKTMSESRFALILLSPTIVLVGGLMAYPLIYSIYLCFVDLNVTRPWLGVRFSGLGNFANVLSDAQFWNSFKITVYFSVAAVVLQLVGGLLVALLLNTNFLLRGVVRSLLLIPWAIPGVVVGLMWNIILNPDYGVLNAILTRLGLIHQGISWLSQPGLALTITVVAKVWMTFPFVALMYLAALQTIPNELYEAAYVDGGTVWSNLRLLTLPLIAPVTLVLLVLQTIDAFRTFDIIYALTAGGPADSTQVIGLYLYQKGFSFTQFGQSAAGSYVLTAFIFVLVFSYFRMSRNSTFVQG